MSTLTTNDIKEKLRSVEDPALGKDIVTLRIFNGAEVSGRDVLIRIAIPTDAYPQDLRAELETRIKRAMEALEPASVIVESEVVTAWSPPPSEKALVKGAKNIIAVASGKGGVGKSTVATNLALALRGMGAKVGLLDTDIFGPSIPQMLGEPEQPANTSPSKLIIPAIHYGIKVISVGFFVDKQEAVVWRGPMVHRLLQQFLQDVEWGDLDYLICDLPPGTGDVQLSLSQLISMTGAVMVTTPQEVAVIDVIKGISMFEKVEVPILGIVENMSHYTCPACGHQDEPFSTGGGKRLAHETKVPFLGDIGIDSRIRFGGDSGVPVVVASPDSEVAERFRSVAREVALKVAERVLSQPKRSARLAVIK